MFHLRMRVGLYAENPIVKLEYGEWAEIHIA